MELLKTTLLKWLKEILVSGILSNLSGLFEGVNERVAEITARTAATPQAFQPEVFRMIRNLSESVMLPVAGTVLAFVMTLELIRLVTDRNSMHETDTWMFFKWIFKTAAAVLIVSRTWDIVMAVFDASGSLVSRSADIITDTAGVDSSLLTDGLESRLMAMEAGELFGIWFQSLIARFTVGILSVCIFLVTYGRMMEIYLMTSVAPVPMATLLSGRSEGIGQNYFRSLLALGFQSFLIIVCVAVYSVLVHSITVSADISAALWECLGYTALLCFCLFKTGSLSHSVFSAH